MLHLEAHSITVEEMPSHNHDAVTENNGSHNHTFYACSGYNGTNTVSAAAENWNQTKKTTSTTGNHNHIIAISNTGDNVAHNIVQPYIAVYIWKRIS